MIPLGILLFQSTVTGSPPVERPASPEAKNIIFLSFDDWGASYFGCYGSGVDSTPTMDALAARGMRFERVYPVSPVCSPSRASWLTGRSPVIHGLIFNNQALSTDMPTFPSLLRHHGYRTGLFGKLHQTPMNWRDPESFDYLGFDEAVVTEDDKWGAWIDWVMERAPDQLDNALAMANGPPQAPRHQYLHERWSQARETIMEPIRERSFIRVAWESPLPAEWHDSAFITDKSLEFLAEQKDADQPFLAYISYVDPHDPYNPPKPYSTMFKPDDMSEPIPMVWDPEEQVMLAETLAHHNIKSLHGDLEGMKRMRALFHGSLRFQDDQVKRIVDFMDANDMWENTILVITTDHGEMMGDHGLITKGSKHYDSGIRVPLIVVGDGIRKGVTDRLTSSLDLYPTFCDWAGIEDERRPPLEGKSFAPVCEGKPAEEWDEVALWACEVGGGAYTIVTDDGWRFTRFVHEEKSSGQMFNLVSDPREQNDLYKDPAYTGKRQELYERLVEATTRPSRIPHYRNMPNFNGEKRAKRYSERAGRVPSGLPVYPSQESPALTGELFSN